MAGVGSLSGAPVASRVPAPETLHCEACEREVAVADATRAETYGDLDPERWQALCCPTCGRKLQTVFVGDE